MGQRKIALSIWVLVTLIGSCLADGDRLHLFYCGFSGEYCGQSNTNDAHPQTSTVILAFGNVQSDGSIMVDDANFPTALVNYWQSYGKFVFLSIGGQNANWGSAFASDASITSFVTSLTKAVGKYKLDGVDIDLEDYSTPPAKVAKMLIQLKTSLMTLGKKLLSVSPECVGVVQSTSVPADGNTASGPFNYWVPIIKAADTSIDFYQVQAYNNWQDGLAGGSLQYLQSVYKNWRNLAASGSPIPNFSGVAGNKLLMGVLASTSAGGPSYYTQPKVITAFRKWLVSMKYPLFGFMMWDTHWDSLNNFAISNAATDALA